MRDNEELCRKCFDHYLADRLGLTPRSWREGEDPPDYYLVVDGQEFAVEVTALVGKETDRRLHSASYRSIAKEIESAAIQQGILSGKYSLRFLVPLNEFGKTRAKIIQKALEFIRNTQGLANTPLETLVNQARLRGCEIKKSAASPNAVYLGSIISGNWVKWGGEVHLEACTLLEKTISEKKRKLRNITMPKVLLVRHGYLFADASIYRQCAQNLGSMDSFHTIFIILDENEGYVLYTQETSWLL